MQGVDLGQLGTVTGLALFIGLVVQYAKNNFKLPVWLSPASLGLLIGLVMAPIIGFALAQANGSPITLMGVLSWIIGGFLASNTATSVYEHINNAVAQPPK